MAKAGTLAGLAALGTAAYLMSKGKDKDKAGEDSNPTRAARPESTEERPRKITDYQAKAPLTGEDMYPSGVMGGATQPRTKTVKSDAGTSKDTGSSADTRDLEAAMTRGMRSKPASSTTPEGMAGYKSRAGSSAGAGRGSVNPPSITPQQPERDTESSMTRGTRPPVVGAGRGIVNPPSVTPQQPARDLEADMSRGRRTEQRGPGQDQIDMIRRLQSAANVPTSRRAGMPGYDEAGNPMRKGGKVKKMASGGMTASRRADGIASRGKTKCKMY